MVMQCMVRKGMVPTRTGVMGGAGVMARVVAVVMETVALVGVAAGGITHIT